MLLNKLLFFGKMQLTFLYISEFDSPFAKCYIDSTDKLILDISRKIDFRLYINKYLRSNEWLDTLLKEDTKLLRRG